MAEQQQWSTWFNNNNLNDIGKLLPKLIQTPAGDPDSKIDNWKPTENDRAFAWELYVELRTRISTQPLHFLSGDEGTALESLYRLFQIVRDLEKKHGVGGFVIASLTSFVLNSDIRPMTARWHKMKLEGKLHPEDLRREFRAKLQDLQPKLRSFQQLLLRIAGVSHDDGSDAELQKVSHQETTKLEGSIPFDRLLGYDCTCKVTADDILSIIAGETREIQDRRDSIRGPLVQEEQKAKVLADAEQARNANCELTNRLDNSTNKDPKTVEHCRSDERLYHPIQDLAGLAVSGGGIRSATFALGVLQGLAQRGILKQVDLLSTVSGGGYIGSFLSTYLQKSDAECGPDSSQAPFRAEVACESRAIRYLRNHSRYIQPATFSGWLTTVGQATYGIVSNLILLSLWVFLAVQMTHLFFAADLRRHYQEVAGNLTASDQPLNYVEVLDSLLKATPAEDLATQYALRLRILWFEWNVTSIALGVCVGLVLLLPVMQRIRRLSNGTLSKVSWYEMFTLMTIVAGGLIYCLDVLPLAHRGYFRLMKAIAEYFKAQGGPQGWSLTATSVAIVNLMGLVAARADWIRKLARDFPLLGRGVFLVLWLCGPVLLSYAYFELTRVYVAAPQHPIHLFGFEISTQMLLWILSLCCFLYSYSCNVNFTSLHRFYRNRLCSAYLIPHSRDHRPKPLERLSLSDLRADPGSTAPYHLINAALNLPASKIDDLRGRDCDFFLFSKHFCGSPVIGYERTSRWQDADEHLDLGTAMAISGAAAAPQMGMGSVRGASFLMTLLNVRLAYWLRRPDAGGKLSLLRRFFTGPGPLYLSREALNWMSEDSPYLNLSDGGHIENLGIYELLRRRCKFIIAIDGEQDPEMTFPSLRRLQRFAEVDLGVTIEMDVERIEWNLPSFFQPSDQGQTLVEDKAAERRRPEPLIQRFSRGHFAVGKISYPEIDGKDAEGKDARVPVTGWLLYVKLSITGNEADYIQDYRRVHPDFPHQTTGDQIFEEDQFEAYRALGKHIADDLFAEEIIANCPQVKSTSQGSKPGFEIPDWFQGLATTMFCGSN